MANKPNRPPSARTNLPSCILATLFLLFILTSFFTLFKPKDPTISLTSVQLPSFSISNNSSANFSFSQYISVKNPNKATFSHYDSTLQLLYTGSQVGFMFVPAGKIEAGLTQYMAATFSVQSFPLSSNPEADQVKVGASSFNGGIGGMVPGNGFRVGLTMEIESRIQMDGRVRVLHFFTHRVKGEALCIVTISVSDESVLGFHC